MKRLALSRFKSCQLYLMEKTHISNYAWNIFYFISNWNNCHPYKHLSYIKLKYHLWYFTLKFLTPLTIKSHDDEPRQSYFTHIICFQITPSRNALIPHNRPTRSTFPTPTPPNSFSVERGVRATCWTVPRGQYGGRALRNACRLTLTLTYPPPYRGSLCVCVCCLDEKRKVILPCLSTSNLSKFYLY